MCAEWGNKNVTKLFVVMVAKLNTLKPTELYT